MRTVQQTFRGFNINFFCWKFQSRQNFLPEHDYGYLLSQIRLSSVCLMSVTFLHPAQPVEIFANVFTPFLQRGLIACNAQRCISHGNSVRPFVCLSVTRWY